MRIIIIIIIWAGIKHAPWYPSRKFIMPLFVRFEVFMSVTMKNAIFWDVTPSGSYKIKSHVA
jgi:hypothetical protein